MSSNQLFTKHLTKACLAAMFAIGLTACSSSDNGGSTADVAPPAPAEPGEPTPAESQMTLIESAQAGLATALAALDTDDPTADQIAAVRSAMTLLGNALAGANDLSPNQTKEARDDLAAAMTVANNAQTTLDTGIATAGRIEMQMTAISNALEDLADALAGDEIADLAAANNAYDALEAAINAGLDLTDAQKASAVTALNMADVTIANAEISKYEADTMADGATSEEMLAAYQGKLTAAKRLAAATAASAADLAKANMAIGAAETKIAQLEKDIQDAKDAVDNATRLANNAKAMRVAEAINAHTVADNPPSEFVTPADADLLTGTGDTNFGVKRVSGAAMISLTQTAAQKKAKSYTETAAPSVMGFMGTQFANTDTSGKRPVMEMAAVYTDIEMAEDIAWTDAALGTLSTGWSVAATGIVTITSGAAVDAVRLGGAVLPSAPTMPDSATERNIAANGRVAGTFYGVSGQFSCGANDCTVTRNSMGVVSASAELTFTPTSSAVASLMAKYADPDTDYTYFGYWMESKENRDGTLSHDIETFSGGGNDTVLTLGSTEGAAVLGTASYYGAAAGVYVKKAGSGDSLVVTNGTFTAAAELTARFGGPSIALDDQYEVEGTISDFMDGSTDLGFADLTLGGADAKGGASFNATGAITGGETDGGGTSGNWIGQFYGNVGAGTDTDASDDFPSDVSGEFNGHFVDGHVAGAFGAEYDE